MKNNCVIKNNIIIFLVWYFLLPQWQHQPSKHWAQEMEKMISKVDEEIRLVGFLEKNPFVEHCFISCIDKWLKKNIHTWCHASTRVSKSEFARLKILNMKRSSAHVAFPSVGRHCIVLKPKWCICSYNEHIAQMVWIERGHHVESIDVSRIFAPFQLVWSWNILFL